MRKNKKRKRKKQLLTKWKQLIYNYTNKKNTTNLGICIIMSNIFQIPSKSSNIHLHCHDDDITIN